ncbi:pyruvate kinase [Streptomyces sp. NPDC127098]|uniref:pyruvate kinase n=1 Tax=Streptomyces sp. NPDC127098 TaxID=3347137 RepID=UPI00364E403D
MIDLASTRTDVAVTIGPSSRDPACVEALVAAGIDIVRLGMCNGTREEHARTVDLVREAADKFDRPVRILADLQGRKNRLGALPGGRADWAAGETVELAARPCRPTSHRTWTKHPWPEEHVRPGGSVLVDDGAVVLRVKDAETGVLRCEVVQGGAVTSGRGVSMPGVVPDGNGLYEGDAEDLRFALTLGVDIVALSFAYGRADQEALRALAPDSVLMAKVEHPRTVDALDEVVEAFDGLMVARGDLALEAGYENVPFIQKRTIAACRRAGAYSMVATQLLYSMQQHARPTRAEVSDVANAVLEGADSLLLAGETAFGRQPVGAVTTLRRIIARAERYRCEAGGA